MSKPEPTVLVELKPRKSSRTHAHDCNWVRGVTTLYKTITVREADAAGYRKCSRCGGGR